MLRSKKQKNLTNKQLLFNGNVHSDNGQTSYADFDLIKKKGLKAKMWSFYDFNDVMFFVN